MDDNIELLKMLAKHYGVTPSLVKVAIKPYSKAKFKACFDNAYHYVTANMGTSYVIGYCLIEGIPVEHAWIKEDENYFDVTLKTNSNKVYYALFELDLMQLLKVVLAYSVVPTLYECSKFLK